MQLDAICAPINDDLLVVNRLLRAQLTSSVSLVGTVSEHIIHSGGKRIRPIILLLTARALGHGADPKIIQLAAIIELIHTATLLHDDVVDNASLRRGLSSANTLWGNAASVLVGDFLYSRAFQLMVGLQNLAVMNVLANTTNLISEGEVLQLLHTHNPDLSEADYFKVIHYKTAALFAAATQLSALISQQEDTTIDAMSQYGKHLGLAFQLIDDALDYSDASVSIGKHHGNDVSEGKTTLPLIYALQHSEGEQKVLLQAAIRQGNTDQFATIQQVIIHTGGIDYVKQRAEQASQAAITSLGCLANSTSKSALEQLASYAVSRDR